jgi:hypothetical protein
MPVDDYTDTFPDPFDGSGGDTPAAIAPDRWVGERAQLAEVVA